MACQLLSFFTKLSFLILVFYFLGASPSDPTKGTDLKPKRLESKSCRCGERGVLPSNHDGKSINLGNFSRIFGGIDAEAGAEKWMAMVEAGGSLCSGSLINSRIVLTAAHCVTSYDGFSVTPAEDTRVWLNRRSGPQEPADGQSELHLVRQLFVHPEYQFPRYDAALLVLKEEIIFDESKIRIRPICLPDEADYFELPGREDGIAFGYGRIDPGSGHELPRNLQQGKVGFIHLEDCLRKFNYVLELAGAEFLQFTAHDVETYICSPGQIEGQEVSFVFKGDSGGPVNLPWTKDNSSRIVQIGVISSGNAPWIPDAKEHDPSISYKQAVGFYTDIFRILSFVNSASIAAEATWCTK